MATQILKINAPATTTTNLVGTTATDDYITFDRTTGASTFSPQVVLSNLATDSTQKLSLGIFDIVNNKNQTVVLPSLTDANAIEYVDSLGSVTALFNGKYKIVSGGDYTTATDPYLFIAATSGNDTSTAPSAATAVASIWGSTGDDNLTGAGGGSAIYGGTGNNTLHGRGTQYDYFRAFTADKGTDTIIEDSQTGIHAIHIYLPSAQIKSWTFKHIDNDLVGSVTDVNGSSYNFTVKNQYLNKSIQSIFIYSEGTAGPNGNGYYAGGDFTDFFYSQTTWAFIAGTTTDDKVDLSATTRNGSRVFGNEGNDSVITKKGSSLFFYAGAGIDSVTYPDASSNYKISITSAIVKNILPTGQTTSDYMESVERVKFSDKALAYDVANTQSGGKTAEILNAAFGKSALANKTFVGIGLSLFDNAMTLADVAKLAIGTGLVSAADDISFVKAVWLNVMGTAITQDNLDTYVGLLKSGTYTQAGLLAVAAATDFNQTAVNLTGLAQTGLEFIPAS